MFIIFAPLMFVKGAVFIVQGPAVRAVVSQTLQDIKAFLNKT
mgnify:CR=1 FL=1